jgi:hypothetical protein
LGAGAAYGGAVILLVEHAPRHQRGFWGGFAPPSVSLGNLLAAGALVLCARQSQLAQGLSGFHPRAFIASA